MDDAECGFRQSLWQATTTEDFQCPVLESDHEADVVIVGGGFTGLSAALHLSEKGKSVVVLEGREIAWGASGRNGGQVNPGWKIKPSRIKAIYGDERGKRILKMIGGACDLVFDLIDHHRIACAPRRAPFFIPGFGARGLKETRDWVREWERCGAPVTFKNQTETQDIVGSTFFHGGLEDARGGSLQPLSYARGLANAATRAGAQVFSGARATRVDKMKSDWVVKCENGNKIAAQYLLITTNGYTDNLWPGLKKQVVPVASLQAATRPLPEEILETILPRGHHLSDTRRAIIYCRIDDSNRFQIGGRGSAFSPVVQQADTTHLQAEALRIFPQLKGIEWEFEWGGLVAMTKSHMPGLIELGDKAYAGMGYNGRGIAMATCMGKQLAELVNGEDIAMPLEKMSPFALHTFRNIGITWHILSGRMMEKFM